MMKKGFPLLQSVKSALEVKRILNLSFGKFIGLSLSMMKSEEGKGLLIQARSANGAIHHLKAINDGDEKEGFLFAGQSVGGIADIPSAQEVIKRIVKEAEEQLKKIGKGIAA